MVQPKNKWLAKWQRLALQPWIEPPEKYDSLVNHGEKEKNFLAFMIILLNWAAFADGKKGENQLPFLNLFDGYK